MILETGYQMYTSLVFMDPKEYVVLLVDSVVLEKAKSSDE